MLFTVAMTLEPINIEGSSILPDFAFTKKTLQIDILVIPGALKEHTNKI